MLHAVIMSGGVGLGSGRRAGSGYTNNCALGSARNTDSADGESLSTLDHLVAMVGVSDCVVVHTPDVTLVARKGDEDAVRQLVALAECAEMSRYL